MEHNKYTSEQMELILKNAIKKQGAKGNISHEDLVATARELGIDENDLQSAIEEYLEGISPLEEAKLEWRKQKRRKFYEHLQTYLIINGMFAGICYYSGADWYIWSVMGWGVGLAFDAFASLFPSDSDVEKGAKKILKKRTLTSAFDTIKSVGKVKVKAGGKDFNIDISSGKIIIEHGDKRIEFGGK